VYTIVPGESIVVETIDCYAGQIRSPEHLTSFDRSRINPLTGPIQIEGAKPGDIVSVLIHSIELKETGIIIAGSGIGAFGANLDGRACRVVSIHDGSIIFNEKISIPIRPMIGSIGVAPVEGEMSSRDAGPNGGNMDTAFICPGTRVYLPVFQEGALLCLGDLHAAMGDGEVGGTGVEVGGWVRLLVELIKGETISNPVLETENAWITLASSENLQQAIDTSIRDMFNLLKNPSGLSDPDIAMLMSVQGSAGICQVVNRCKTARFVVPKTVCNNRLMDLD
jgi:amidase